MSRTWYCTMRQAHIREMISQGVRRAGQGPFFVLSVAASSVFLSISLSPSLSFSLRGTRTSSSRRCMNALGRGYYWENGVRCACTSVKGPHLITHHGSERPVIFSTQFFLCLFVGSVPYHGYYSRIDQERESRREETEGGRQSEEDEETVAAGSVRLKNIRFRSNADRNSWEPSQGYAYRERNLMK